MTSIAVFGGNSTIGREIVRLLLESKHSVVVLARNIEKLSDLMELHSGSLHFVYADLQSLDEISDYLDKAVLKIGRLHGLIYVSGFHQLMPIGMGTAYSKSLELHFKINTIAPLIAIDRFVSNKISDPSTSRYVTIVSSIANQIGEPALSAYSASKAAIVGAFKSLSIELARKGIRLNTVSPGWIEGETAESVKAKLGSVRYQEIIKKYPLGSGLPLDVAEAVFFISSNKARWITGTDLVVDGGRSCS